MLFLAIGFGKIRNNSILPIYLAMHDFLNTKEIPEPANIILAELADGIQNIQFDFIKGMYLTGSIPLNDFHPDKSDIDFLILCKNSPDKKLLLQLDRLHKTILNRYKKPDLSGCYLTIDKLNARDPSTMEVLSFREGKM